MRAFTRSAIIRGVFPAVLAGVLLLAAGCSKGQVKPSEAEQEFRKIQGFLSGLTQAYSQKDLEGFRNLFLTEFRDQHRDLFEAVAKTFREGGPTQLDLSVDLIQIDNQNITVFLHWEVGAAPVEKPSAGRGNTTLYLAEEQQLLKISSIEGDNPFLPGPAPLGS